MPLKIAPWRDVAVRRCIALRRRLREIESFVSVCHIIIWFSFLLQIFRGCLVKRKCNELQLWEGKQSCVSRTASIKITRIKVYFYNWFFKQTLNTYGVYIYKFLHFFTKIQQMLLRETLWNNAEFKFWETQYLKINCLQIFIFDISTASISSRY